MSTTTAPPRPSQAWIAKAYPIVDAPPEIQAAITRYCPCRLRLEADRTMHARAAFIEAEDALIEASRGFLGYYVCTQGLVQIVRRRTGHDYAELMPRSSLLRDRPRLEDP